MKESKINPLSFVYTKKLKSEIIKNINEIEIKEYFDDKYEYFVKNNINTECVVSELIYEYNKIVSDPFSFLNHDEEIKKYIDRSSCVETLFGFTFRFGFDLYFGIITIEHKNKGE